MLRVGGAYWDSDWADVSRIAEAEEGLVPVEVGWGLVLMTLAAIAGGVMALGLVFEAPRARKERSEVPPTAHPPVQ